MAISQETDLILQSYFSVVLITELKNNNFLESDFYKHMNFNTPGIKELIKQKISIDNQGMLLMFLYAMLVIPKELIGNKYKKEYSDINQYLNGIAKNTHTDYEDDSPTINYLRHIRNSVAHSRVEFLPNKYIVFNDNDNKRNNSFRTEIDLYQVGLLLNKLQEVHVLYWKDNQ